MATSIRKTCAVILLAVFGLFVLNCIGDDGNNSQTDDGFSTGIDGNKQTGELSNDEEQAICDEMIDYGGSSFSKEVRCELASTGAFADWPEDDEGVRQLCQEQFEDCMDSDRYEDTAQFCVQAPEGCSVTVAELEECLEIQVSGRKEYLDSMPRCESTTRDEIDEFNANFENSPLYGLPDECRAIEQECQGYFSGSSSSN